MQLKSIEIQGFKTFPEKTVLTIQPGLTAVVGPNGSGKSNIAEALRWVLGEQNPRVLRCEKRMEEIIFHGTERRGAVGFAEVSLRLDNSDRLFPQNTDEVVLSRRLYRSGESEYYINRAAVRLKDITELLMDTGLGTDGYSIIGQGMVKKIISDRAGDRRRVFEEAAGISRYRHRKEESERRLAGAQENLVRIGDKIDELAPQAEALKQQAEVARQYLLLRDELRAHEINLWMDALYKIRRTFDALRDGYRVAKEQVSAGEEALRAFYAQSDSVEERAVAASLDAENARGVLGELEAKLAAVESAQAVLQADMTHFQENIDRILAEIELQEAKAGGLDDQIGQAVLAIEQHEAELTCANEDLSAVLSDIETLAKQTHETSAMIDALRARELDETMRAGEVRVESAALRAQLQELHARGQALLADRQARERASAEAEGGLAAAQSRLLEAKTQVAELENVIEGYEIRKQSRQKRADALREKLSALELEHNSTKTRHHLLSEQEREYQGFYGSVKVVMQQKLPGVHGTVSELLSVDDAYALAIETVLGSALQNIVVQSEEDAKRAIALLKSRGAGRATFLPLSSVRGSVMREPAGEAGFIGMASSLASADALYEGILHSLLGRTAVVSSLDDGIAMAKKHGYAFRIVTLDGQVLNVGGAISGGSAGKTTGILSRKNELLALQRRLEALETELTALRQSSQTTERELTAAVYDLDTAGAELRQAREAVAAQASEVEHRQILLDSHRAHLEALAAERGAADTRIEALSVDLATLDRRAEAHTEAGLKLQAEREELETGHGLLSERGSELSNRLAAGRELKVSLQEKLLSRRRTLQDLEGLRRELAGDGAQRDAALASYRQRQTELHEKLSEQTTQRDALALEIDAQKSALQEIYARQQHMEAERAAVLRGIKEQNEQCALLERECARMENKLVTGEAEERAIVDRLWEQYELTPSAAEKLRTPVDSLQRVTRRIAELKRDIGALGPPNIGAIEAYREVSGRYELLASQRDDAVSAKLELEKIIADITAEMRRIFSEQFELVNRLFGQVFTEIFGGGEAMLELEDPDDVLGSGVDIKAQPPGKKLRSISLLSGGETSLTAIALYFAIFKVRPAPFCMLDELDHDLDDANVSRFAAYLSRLSQSTQFIVITHRRGTMECADILYGVTAQEAGVSKVLSLRLSQVEQALNMKTD